MDRALDRPYDLCTEFVIGLVTYAVVALLEYKKIRKVPMGEALKNAE